jgi:hypothetical protein
MSEETITILEAATLLHKSERTLYRYIEAGKIAATLGPDRKYHLLKSDIVERSERQLTRQIDQTENILLSVQKRLDNVTLMSRQLTRQQEQIDNLEKELALLKEQIAVQNDSRRTVENTPVQTSMTDYVSGTPEPQKRISRASKASHGSRDLPPGAILASYFARDHGVNERTFADHCKKGYGPSKELAPVSQRPKPSREYQTEFYVLPEQMPAVLDYWRRHGVKFSEAEGNDGEQE